MGATLAVLKAWVSQFWVPSSLAFCKSNSLQAYPMCILPSAILVYLGPCAPPPKHIILHFSQIKGSRPFTQQAHLDLRHGNMIHLQHYCLKR